MNLNHQEKLICKLLNILLIMFLPCQAIAINQDTRQAEVKYFDEKLNSCYKKILQKLGPVDQVKLRKAQRQWIIFRDLDCNWAYSVHSLDCLITRTETRIKELEDSKLYYRDLFRKKDSIK